VSVTAVVTCFNYGAYLPEAVASLLAQEPAPEVVVVDDGSTDPATLVALDHLPPGVRVIRQPNAGVCAARNRGLAEAHTEFVLCLDADDRLAPGSLALLRSALDEHPSAGFAYGHQRFVGGWDGEMRFPPYDPLRLLDRHLIGPTALMRASMVSEIGGFDPAFKHYEDWELWINALAHGWYGTRVDAIVHEYRRGHEGAKLGADRLAYRATRRQLRAKHRALYARRAQLAAESDLGAGGRALYRWFWGPRPVPAAVEAGLHRLLWRGSSG
jgi:glycosyltransferase involved in cell wall biosynthesis